VDFNPQLETEDPGLKTFPPLPATQLPGSGPSAISGSGASGPKQQEGAPPMRSLGRFQLLGVVGQGSFGTVYRAYDPVLEREVALKVPKNIGREREQFKRFLIEAKAAARLRHPNIVAVFEAGEADGVDYIATEFVSGEPLSRLLKRERPSFRQAAQWVRDLALGLEYAHGEGVIHRDIKPDNIMIGESQRPQLMDFGLAKVVAEAAPAHLLKPVTGAGIQASGATTDGTIMGTPAYMAPEQARGDVNAVGPHSDQYSLGVVLYELLTGQRPQIAKPAPGSSTLGSGEIFVHVTARPRQVDPKIPKNLEAVCLKAMAKEPSDRYASAADLAVDLQRWLKDDPVNARRLAIRQQAEDLQYGAAARLVAQDQAEDLQRAVQERLTRRHWWSWQRPHPRLWPGLILKGLIRWTWNNPKPTLVALLGIIAFMTFQLIETRRAQHQLRCDWNRDHGLLRCEQKNPREGLLFLLRAYEIATEMGDADRQDDTAKSLLEWARKVPIDGSRSPIPEGPFHSAVAQLMATPTPGYTRSAKKFMARRMEIIRLWVQIVTGLDLDSTDPVKELDLGTRSDNVKRFEELIDQREESWPGTIKIQNMRPRMPPPAVPKGPLLYPPPGVPRIGPSLGPGWDSRWQRPPKR
jgi:serine/threonine protein kinase